MTVYDIVMAGPATTRYSKYAEACKAASDLSRIMTKCTVQIWSSDSETCDTDPLDWDLKTSFRNGMEVK